MKMHKCLSLAVISGAFVPLALAGKVCSDVEFSVTISATAVQVPTTLTLDSLISYWEPNVESLINVPISGSYAISGTHCTSTVTNQDTSKALLRKVDVVYNK